MGGPAAPGGVVDQLPDHDRRPQQEPGPIRVPGPRRRPRLTTGRQGHCHTAATANTTMGTAVTTSAATVKGVVAAAAKE